jgi:hypothetical protein
MCRCTTNDKIVVVSENNRKFTILNQDCKLIEKIKVDGCLIDDNRERCDYVFEIDSPCELAIYLELKGRNIEKAYSQLVSTLGYLSSSHASLKRECHIVASRVPKAGPKVQELKAKLAKYHKVQLFVHTTKAQINI